MNKFVRPKQEVNFPKYLTLCIMTLFHINRHRGWECGPKNVKNFHFLVGTKKWKFLTFFDIMRVDP